MKCLIMEALNDYQKKYVDEKLGGSRYDSNNSHPDIFGDEDRVFLDVSGNKTPLHESIIQHLFKHGYEVDDGDSDLAKKKFIDRNGDVKYQYTSIGKILHRTNGDNIKTNITNKRGDRLSITQLYANNKGVNKNLQLVISRNKCDIAGMSTDRHWDSCMALPSNDSGKGEGSNHHVIANDLKHHTLVAYLINKGDDNIEKPLGRTLIKKYSNTENGDIIYRAVKSVYGNMDDRHVNQLNDFMRKYYPIKSSGDYQMNNNLYRDGQGDIKENVGLIKFEHGYRHYNENSLLNDYLNEKGESIPAENLYGKTSRYNNGILHSEKNVPTIVHNNGGEEYYRNGLKHRDGIYPSVIRKDNNGKISSLCYHKFDLLHSIDNDTPSISNYVDGKVSDEHYHRYGLEHRDNDLPAVSIYDVDTGIPTRTDYYKNGLLHRENNKPATVKKLAHMESVGYYLNGVLHNDDNNIPSLYTKEDYGGVLITNEKYAKNGKFHREGDLPAVRTIVNNRNKGIISKVDEYYDNGNIIKTVNDVNQNDRSDIDTVYRTPREDGLYTQFEIRINDKPHSIENHYRDRLDKLIREKITKDSHVKHYLVKSDNDISKQVYKDGKLFSYDIGKYTFHNPLDGNPTIENPYSKHSFYLKNNKVMASVGNSEYDLNDLDSMKNSHHRQAIKNDYESLKNIRINSLLTPEHKHIVNTLKKLNF